MPLFLLQQNLNGNPLPIPGKSGFVIVESDSDGRDKTQFNLHGKYLLYSREGMIEHRYDSLIRKFEEGKLPFEPQTRTTHEGGLPLIIYLTHQRGIVDEPWAKHSLHVITLGKNPLTPGKNYQVSYQGPRTLVSYQEVVEMGLPFLDEIRRKTSELNGKVLETYRKLESQQKRSVA